jgi:hypothetical protein
MTSPNEPDDQRPESSAPPLNTSGPPTTRRGNNKQAEGSAQADDAPVRGQNVERIKNAQTVISIISLAVGLPTGAVGMWHTVFGKSTEAPAAALKIAATTPSEKEILETQKLREELGAGEPRFDVTYLVVSSDAFPGWPLGGGSLGSFIRGKTLENEVLDRMVEVRAGEHEWSADGIDWASSIHEKDRLRAIFTRGSVISWYQKIVCVQLKQEGRRKAENLRLTFRRFPISKAIEVTDVGALATEDWFKEHRLENTATEEVVSANALAQNESLIVPLFVIDNVGSRADVGAEDKSFHTWPLLRFDIFLPVKLQYDDALLSTPHEVPVRKMFKTPEVLEPGVETRG